MLMRRPSSHLIVPSFIAWLVALVPLSSVLKISVIGVLIDLVMRSFKWHDSGKLFLSFKQTLLVSINKKIS